jgi:anti-sigma B factor antagonist
MGEIVAGGVPTGRVGFNIAENWVERVVVVAVTGDVDMITVPDLAEAIDAAARKEPSALIVDLSKVEFLASAGINLLVAVHREITFSARFAVVADGPATSRPLKLIGIDEIVALYSTLDEALADFVDA